MKSKIFEVPSEIMTQFVDQMNANDLVNFILGTTEDNEVIIEVQYEPEDKFAVFELTEMVEDYEEEYEETEDVD